MFDNQPAFTTARRSVDGVPGAALFGDPGGPELVGSLLGATWLRLAAVETEGLSLAASWTDASGLAAMSRRRLTRLGDRLTHAERIRAEAVIAALPGLLAGRRPGFVHGDFLPVNIIVRKQALAALLDFEYARLADPLLDAGCLSSVVAFHHPPEARVAWAAFAKAAGLDLEHAPTRHLLAGLPVIRFRGRPGNAGNRRPR